MTGADVPVERGTIRSRVLVVGSGFAGFFALRRLERLLPPDAAALALVSPVDYLLYSPLLPEVATGTMDPRHIAVPLRQSLRRTRVLPGHVTEVDLDGRTVTVRGRDGADTVETWGRLVLAPGSVSRQFDIPGVAEHAHGFKTLTEALYLRDHVLAQLDAADALPDTDAGRAERRERLTVVAVGAGYTGTEFVAQMQGWLRGIASRWDTVDPAEVRWILVDAAPRVLPELGPRLGDHAMGVLTRRGVDVRLGVSVASASATEVVLADGTTVASRTLVWGAGVAASPLVATLGLPTEKGRLVVGADMAVPGHEHVWALGDAAAVPDLTAATGQDGARRPAPPTAQHAQRQGLAVARNVAASLGVGRARPYRHRDLGLVADLGGSDAVASPLGVALTGRLAKAVTRGYHLYALPGIPAKVRVATDWLLAAALPTQVVQLSAIPDENALMARAQATGIYPTSGRSGVTEPQDGVR